MNDFIRLAEEMVRENVLRNSGNKKPFDVYVVWFCKAAENAKALLSTTLPDHRYYEVTLIGNERTVVLDVYQKHDKVVAGDVDVYWGPDHELRKYQ